jgi:dTMP kinase
LQPDLTLLFDVPLEVARERLQRTRNPDKFEQEQDNFFVRVRQVYLQRAQQFPQRIRVIDSTRPIDQISAELQQLAAELCE